MKEGLSDPYKEVKRKEGRDEERVYVRE